MAKNTYPDYLDDSPDIVQKRVRKIKKFYKELTSWAGTSVFLIALNLFLSGNISWAKFPVFFWGIFIVASVFDIMRIQREQKAWEERQAYIPQSAIPQTKNTLSTPLPAEDVPDYTDELLNREEAERAPADLTEVRKLKRPWKDEDLV